MNYYAQGGQAHGLKSIAQELQDMGRGGDTILAHINPQEAAMLKRMGGSGTINPNTGLPEFIKLKNVFKPVENIAKGIEKAVIRPIGNALEPILPYVQYVAPFIPGVGPLAAAGLGALGSGFAGPGGFNFKRGLMGGMTAYGLSNLYAGVQAAGGATPGSSIPSTDIAAANVAPDPIAALNQSQGFTGVGEAELLNSVNPSGISSVASDFSTQMGNAGQGLKNLTGVGETTLASGDALKAAGSQFGTGSAMGIYGGVTGTAALNEYDKMKDEADLAAAKDETERAAIMARIEDGRRRAEESVRNNPYQFACGGSVDDETGFDDFNNYMGGGIASMAKGGMAPRFLSGGGDGMSDDIPATINGKQPARLADGEFVVPADVVSHLGNGSSKAGAKQLYSMMDKVRTARTGNKKQGKEINPAKYMPA